MSRSLLIPLLALALAAPALADTAKRVEFRGDPATEAATLVKAQGVDGLRGLRAVIIPQFTVEFVQESNGLNAKEEKRQGVISVTYQLTPLADAERQALTERLYARFVAGLTARGVSVRGPADAMATAAWAKLGKDSRVAPAVISRDTGVNHLYSAAGGGFTLPMGATSAATKATGDNLQRASTGAALAGAATGSSMLGKLGGFGRMAAGIGGGFSNFGKAMAVSQGEPALATETGAAVVTVRMVVGLRDTNMAGRGFDLFRGAGSYKGAPKLVVQSEGTEVTVQPPLVAGGPGGSGGRATLVPSADLVFAEDLFAGKLEAANGTGGKVGNALTRTAFVGAALFGGSMSMNQSYKFIATPEPAAYAAAIERNLGAVGDMMLARLATAW